MCTENLASDGQAVVLWGLWVLTRPVFPLEKEVTVHVLGQSVLGFLIVVSFFVDFPVDCAVAEHVFVGKLYVPACLVEVVLKGLNTYGNEQDQL